MKTSKPHKRALQDQREIGPIFSQILYLTDFSHTKLYSFHCQSQLFHFLPSPYLPCLLTLHYNFPMPLSSLQAPRTQFSIFSLSIKWIFLRESRAQNGQRETSYTHLHLLSETCLFWLQVLFNSLLLDDGKAWNIRSVCWGLEWEGKSGKNYS